MKALAVFPSTRAQRAYYATRILLQNGFKAGNLSGGMLSHSMLTANSED